MTSLAFALTRYAEPALWRTGEDEMASRILPRGIALCGYPDSGKTTVAEILQEHYGVIPIDDGHVLRDFAVAHLGLSWEDTRTQAGKDRVTCLLGKCWKNREILGEFGKLLEGMFGEHILPWIATRDLNPAPVYSFPSCRKTQGWFYRAWGGIVVEVVKDGTAPKFDFDRYDETAVQLTINNHTMDRPTLVREVRRVFDPILAPTAINAEGVDASDQAPLGRYPANSRFDVV